MRRGWFADATGSLTFRLLAFLSLALLPIGLIAVYQTSIAERDARERAELAILALTEQAARSERDIIQRAFGAARAFATTVEIDGATPDRCVSNLSRFVQEEGSFTFVGFLPPSGVISCSTLPQSIDLTGTELMTTAFRETGRWAEVGAFDFTGPEPMIYVGYPISRDAGAIGYAIVAVPQAEVRPNYEHPVFGAPIALTTFNRTGAILSAEADGGSQDWLPRSEGLMAFISVGSRVFSATSRDDRDLIYAVAPMVDSAVYTIGAWSPEALGVSRFDEIPPWLFPILMWLASLTVAYVAVHQLVIRPVGSLRRQIQLFQRDRNVPEPAPLRGKSTEMEDLEDSLIAMAESIVRDEARLEDSVTEKNTLLKEIHHRVKNNLQLIASIMNMQLRKSHEGETKMVIRRLQARVLSLATVHRNLYQFEALRRIEADRLLRETLEQISSLGLPADVDVDVTHELEPVILGPDQAVAVALLASEAITNAIRFLGWPEEGQPWVHVAFAYVDAPAPTARLTVANSAGTRVSDAPGESVGLGTQLMQAFASQLNADLKIRNEPDRYAVEVQFVVGEPDIAFKVAA